MTPLAAVAVALQGRSLSEHLTLKEFLWSDHHPDLVPGNVAAYLASEQLQANAARLGVAFELAHGVVGRLRVSSGYRFDALNRAAGGSGYQPGQKLSAHTDARAVDVVPLDLDMLGAFQRLRAAALPIEKLIWERGAWIHLQVPKAGEEPRRAALMWFGDAYLTFNEADSRVRALALA